MKPSEAMRIGNEVTIGMRGKWFTTSGNTCKACAVGSILVGKLGYGEAYRRHAETPILTMFWEQFPELKEREFDYPKGSDHYGQQANIVLVINDMFEYCGWSRPQIERWLKEQDL